LKISKFSVEQLIRIDALALARALAYIRSHTESKGFFGEKIQWCPNSSISILVNYLFMLVAYLGRVIGPMNPIVQAFFCFPEKKFGKHGLASPLCKH